MPIQGEKYGDQEQQRILKEYDERFDAIEEVLGDLDCYAIRIDKEAPLDGLVDQIKKEISKANFVIADLTDERPSCYFEVGYAEALGVPVIHITSKQSVVAQERKRRFTLTSTRMSSSLRTTRSSKKSSVSRTTRIERSYWPSGRDRALSRRGHRGGGRARGLRVCCAEDRVSEIVSSARWYVMSG